MRAKSSTTVSLFVALISLISLSTCSPVDAPAFKEYVVEVGDVRLHARIAGDPGAANVLIAIHGGPGNSSDYMVSLEELQGDEIAVVTYDQRGTGQSSTPSEGYDLIDYVGDLEAIRNYFGAEKVHLLGHSWGGIIAMRYVTIYPQKVETLILMGSGPPNAEAARVGQANLAQRIAELQNQGLIEKELPTSIEELLLAILPAYFSDPRFKMPAELKRMSFHPSASDQTYAAIGDWDFTEEVGQLQHSILFLWGEDDPFDLSMAEATRAALTSAEVEFVLLEDCGHFWHECPQEFFSHVRAFLGLPTIP